MMSWSPPVVWVLIALLLGLSELLTGGVVMLALGAAALLTAGVAALDASYSMQLLAMGIFSGVLAPLAVWKLQPHFSPRGMKYGNTGSGQESGQRFKTLTRDFDQATVIKIKGDLYRLRVAGSGEMALPDGTPVILDHFEGATAIVHLENHPEEGASHG
ncbi:nodulation efficiency, NfeD-like protein [Modicisalibacter tunisiensis]|nr:nodulation efficiency, NfeD-like protein [Modicisalibacter tunisiensis]